MGERTNLLSISAVAAHTGLRPSALRFYEDAGLISPAERVGGRRHYDPSVLRRLDVIALCQEVGFTISEIAQLVKGPGGGGSAWRGLAERKLEEIGARIDRATATRKLLKEVLACGCGDPAGCEMVRGAADRRFRELPVIPLHRSIASR